MKFLGCPIPATFHTYHIVADFTVVIIYCKITNFKVLCYAIFFFLFSILSPYSQVFSPLSSLYCLPVTRTKCDTRSVPKKAKKVKCTLVQALRLCTGRTTYRSRDIALPFHDHGTRRGWGVSVTHRPIFTPRKDPVPTVHEAGWAPGPVWTGAESLAATRIRSPDRPARSQSVYRLSYPGPLKYQKLRKIICNITCYL